MRGLEPPRGSLTVRRPMSLGGGKCRTCRENRHVSASGAASLRESVTGCLGTDWARRHAPERPLGAVRLSRRRPPTRQGVSPRVARRGVASPRGHEAHLATDPPRRFFITRACVGKRGASPLAATESAPESPAGGWPLPRAGAFCAPPLCDARARARVGKSHHSFEGRLLRLRGGAGAAPLWGTSHNPSAPIV
jgi:hypothetical protein